MKSPMKSAFSGWKIALALIIGLSISCWVLYRSISQIHFVEVKDGTGTHAWVDGNSNKIIDIHDESDFKLSKQGTYREQTVSDALSQVNWTSSSWFWMIGALVFMVFRDFFYMLRIRLLTKNKLTWRAAFYVIMIWEFASALSPGVVGGAAVAMFILNRETIPFGRATAIVIITAFMDNLFYVVMIPFVFLFIHHSELFPVDQGSSVTLTWWFWVGFGIIFLICSLLYLTIFWYPKLATRFLLFIFRIPFLKRWKFIAKEWGKDIEKASKEFKQETRLFWGKVFLTTMASWISRYLVINAILNAFLDLGFMDNIKVLGQQLVLWLFMLVSPTPGGSGVAEFAFGELLASFSSSAILLAGLAILWRLISYFPYLFIGSILLPAWIRRTRK
ncbi:MAG: lysylphosphatidylglycerol synthase transmembrane domain-containing protein [Crocinitomicaceae bacterium]|nr:lysylphosphatidylglycerol synthase transmembrane domain-containing protein [Crocinitomicaceae bacterium]MDG1657625.1 lysylphosphatidylglycerol synthase transmembrane domain-containing protein [Crocinitomicaceae bacterium]MDG2440982.1 lysylphosphatidylglycerol synthase transmembrane domain-containing protein [Crocinitomicaceae bacterium]